MTCPPSDSCPLQIHGLAEEVRALTHPPAAGRRTPGRHAGHMSRTECPAMPARNIKRYLAVVAAAAAAGLGAAAPAAASASLAAAPASALATASGGGAGEAPTHDLHLTPLTPAMSEDP